MRSFGRRFFFLRGWLVPVSLALCVGVTGCSSGGSSVLRAIAPIAPSPSAAASATPITPASAAALAARADSAAKLVSSAYQTLPHASASADLAALASAMLASKQFATAVVSAGGITAQFPDGTPYLVFGDHLGDPAQKQSGDRRASSLQAAASVAPGTRNIAWFVNTTDTKGAFHPDRQKVEAAAVQGSALGDAGFTTSVNDVKLATVTGFNASKPLDVFDISTHGMQPGDIPGIGTGYAWASDTTVTEASLLAWKDDVDASRLIEGTFPVANAGPQLGSVFAFTPQFLQKYVTFNPGAIVINESCFGRTDLASATAYPYLTNVARYFGWDDEVQGDDADSTDAFIWDRLIGEYSTALSTLVDQRNPPQRAFSLDDITTAMKTENRSGPIGTTSLHYSNSPNGQFVTLASFDSDTLQTSSIPIIEEGLPSISRLEVAETSSGGTLTIYGSFPSVRGTVAILDPGAANPTFFTPTTWLPDHIVVTIPTSGLNSKGAVVALSVDGVQSNAVNLTQWSGTLTSTETADISSLGANNGSGSGTVTVAYTVDFRADVHSTVPAIDTSPVPQNLTFPAPEADSSAQVTSITGSFMSDDGKNSSTFGLAASPALAVAAPPLAYGTFDLGALPNQPASCNNALPGPQKGPTNVFCPGIGYNSVSTGSCLDTNGSSCLSPLWPAEAIFGAPTIANDGVLIFTMDPQTYAITVSDATAQTTADTFEGLKRFVRGDVSGTINAPLSAPQNGEYPAAVRRAVARAFRARQAALATTVTR
jgi:hypothetical protein